MKRIAAWMLMLMLTLALCLPAFAEATVKPEDERMEPVYTFDLAVNGKHEVAVQPGEYSPSRERTRTRTCCSRSTRRNPH